jgi:hypothetical protein
VPPDIIETAVRTAINGIIDVSNEAPVKVGSPQPGIEINPIELSGGTGIFSSSIHLRRQYQQPASLPG